MFINSTLVVQIGSFFIAYGMLRILLFKPTVKIILEEEVRRHEVDERIAAATQSIHQLMTSYQERITHDQRLLEAQSPVVLEHELQGAEMPDLRTPPIPQSSELTTLQDAVAKTIVKKVTHVS